jgi:16S rRNA (guanine966-N2)-methyltransferase
MRITGGAARGIGLKVPKGDATRPATDKLRLAVFSSLGDIVAGARFADLFAGSGAYGLEAWSRGASGGVFVEKDRRTAGLLAENIAAVAKSARADAASLRVVTADVTSLWIRPGEAGAHDLIFIDPPYGEIPRLWIPVFARAGELLKPGDAGLVVFELPANLHPPPAPGWRELRRLDAGGGQPTASFWARIV